MVRIAPVRLSFNPKTLWFEAGALELRAGDAVVVTTARGLEFGHVSQAVFEMDYEETKKLRSPLKPVLRLATEEDVAKDAEMTELSMMALPIFRQIAAETVPEMNPIAVEYLFDGSKAVFYFDADDRVDFRDLVRKLAAELHVRVDMKQIGVRDGARMVGGLGHCGQELCCRRLGGEFNPVSIRMAKEQDLSLNPQKISGICGRLMCCLRYEFEAYKDFHSRAPKKNARITTPVGEGKVVDLDVPREVISIKVGDEKPVKVPLADMEPPKEEGARPNEVGEEAWEQATTPVTISVLDSSNLFTSQLSAEDQLAEPGKVRHTGEDPAQKQPKSRSRRRGGSGRSGGAKTEAAEPVQRKQRRRSTTVTANGDATVTKPSERQAKGAEQEEPKKKPRRRSRGRGGSRQSEEKQPKTVQVGRNSSALRANRQEKNAEARPKDGQAAGSGSGSRRRRRSHKAGSSQSASEQ